MSTAAVIGILILSEVNSIAGRKGRSRVWLAMAVLALVLQAWKP